MAKRFNPYGLHAIHIPLALVIYDGASGTRKSLSWGAKVLYGRLALFLGRPKANSEPFCNPCLETMASTMATSVDTIGRWLRELIDHGFIERSRNGRAPAEIIFLAHPCSSRADIREYGPDSASSRNQGGGSNSADSQMQADASTTQSCTTDSATLPVQFRSSAAPTPQNCSSLYMEEDIHENLQENTQRQHHRLDIGDHGDADADDVALRENRSSRKKSSSTFLRSIAAAAGRQLSPGDLVFCRALERRGIKAETVCAGIYLGRMRKLVNDDQHRIRGDAPPPPARSLRYFATCIEEARGLSPDYIDHVRRRVSQHEAKSTEQDVLLREPGVPDNSGGRCGFPGRTIARERLG
jgi:hypothetical protein